MALAERLRSDHKEPTTGIPDTLRRLVDAPEPAWVWDAQRHKAVWANKSGLAFWQVSDRAALKNKSFDAQHPLAVAAREALEKLNSQENIFLPIDLKPAASVVRWCCFTRHSLPDGHAGLLVRLQEPSMPSSAQADTDLSINLQHPHLSIIRTTPNGTIIYCNEAAAKTFDVQEGQSLIAVFGNALSKQPADGVPVLQKLVTVVGTITVQVTRRQHTDNAQQVTHFWTFDEAPPPTATNADEVVLQPYAEQTPTDTAQAAALSALDTAGVGVLLLQEHGVITSLSAAALKWLEGDASLYIDKPLSDFVDAENAQKLKTLFANGAATADNHFAMGNSITLQLPNKQTRVVSLTLRPHQKTAPSHFWALLYPTQAPALVDNASVDNTPAVWNQHSDMLLAHEIRSPLNAIMGYTELLKKSLQDQGAPAQYQEWLQNIQEAGSHIAHLTSDILEQGKLSQNDAKIVWQEVSVADVMRTCQRLALPQARANNVNIDLHILPACPMVRSDSTSLQQIITNLLSNAIKASPNGGTVHMIAGATKSGRVMIEITDEGQGLTPEEIALVMQPFERLQNTPTPQEGTGLGLPIVRRLADMLGIRFALDSSPDIPRTRARLIFAEDQVV